MACFTYCQLSVTAPAPLHTKQSWLHAGLNRLNSQETTSTELTRNDLSGIAIFDDESLVLEQATR